MLTCLIGCLKLVSRAADCLINKSYHTGLDICAICLLCFTLIREYRITSGSHEIPELDGRS